MAKNVA